MNQSNLILIIARESGKHDVSKQNLRLVNGKPLLYYVLKTSQMIRGTETIISTDSEEVKQLGKHYQVPVIERPKRLTSDETKLDEIAIDALKKLKQNGKSFKKCLILHPHFPLIKKETIKSFFSNLNDNISIIYGYEKNDDELFGKISKKSELKILKNDIVKIKKIVSFDTKKLLEKKRVKKFGLGISSNEIFTPSSYHDFAVLESVMRRKKIIVRVDGDFNIGLGHVYNMLTILNGVRNEDILILMKRKSNLGIKKFREHLYNVKTFSNESQFWKMLNDFKPNIIFNDILNTSTKYVQKLKKTGIFVVNFEDLGNGRKIADLVFNPIFHNRKSLGHEFYGSKYACVREEFRIFQNNIVHKKISKIAITLGGVDKNNNTLKIINLIKKSKLLHNVEIKIILGLGFQHKKELESVVKNMNSQNYNIILIEKVDLLSKYLIDCDFVITSNGRTVFEVGSLNIPMISISVNNREKQHNFVKQFDVGYHLNFVNNFDKKFVNTIQEMMKYSIRKRKKENLKKINLKKGIERVISKILTDYDSSLKLE